MRTGFALILVIVVLVAIAPGVPASDKAPSSSSEGYSAGTFPLKTLSVRQNCGLTWFAIGWPAHFEGLSGNSFTFTLRDHHYSPEYMLICAYRGDDLSAWNEGESSTLTLTTSSTPDDIYVWIPAAALLSSGKLSLASTGQVHMSSR